MKNLHSYFKFFFFYIGLFSGGAGGVKQPPIIGAPSPNSCPVCGIQLSASDFETHFLAELDRLYKLSQGNERQKIKASLGMNAMHGGGVELQGSDSRYESFQRIRTNRQGRLRAKQRKRRSDSESEYMEVGNPSACQNCPVCHGRLQRTSDEIAQHIEDCIRKSRQIANNDEDETVDVESYGDETTPSAMNMSQQTNLNINNNNNTINKLDMSQTVIQHPPQREENVISSLSSLHTPWERKARMNCE